MMLFRLILIAVIGFLVYRIYRSMSLPRDGTARSQTLGSEPMVQCALCEVHVPRNIAVAQDDHWYCSREHLSLHQQKIHPDRDQG